MTAPFSSPCFAAEMSSLISFNSWSCIPLCALLLLATDGTPSTSFMSANSAGRRAVLHGLRAEPDTRLGRRNNFSGMVQLSATPATQPSRSVCKRGCRLSALVAGDAAFGGTDAIHLLIHHHGHSHRKFTEGSQSWASEFTKDDPIVGVPAMAPSRYGHGRCVTASPVRGASAPGLAVCRATAMGGRVLLAHRNALPAQ